MLRGVPPDVPELESDDQFFKDLCDLMEEHKEERGYSLEELLFNMRSFTEEWMFSLFMTGQLWETAEMKIESESVYIINKYGAHGTGPIRTFLLHYRDMDVDKDRLEEVLENSDKVVLNDGLWEVKGDE